MSLYYIIFGIIFVSGALQVMGKRQLEPNSRVLFFALCVGLCIFIGGRACGYDYQGYLTLYDYAKAGFQETEIGYYWLCRICPTPRTMFLAMAVLTMVPFYEIVKRHSAYPLFTLLLFATTFLFPTVMGQMRQGVAIFMVLTAYFCYRDKQWFKAVIFFLIALSFHNSTLIAILFLLPLNRKLNMPILLGAVVIALMVGTAVQQLLSDYIQLLDASNDMRDKFEYYESTETMQGLTLGINTAVIIRLIVFGLGYLQLCRHKAIDPAILNLYFLSILVYLALGGVPQIGGRGSQYFAALDLFIIPQIFRNAIKQNRLILLSAFLVLSLLRFIQFFSDSFNASQYIPYRFL